MASSNPVVNVDERMLKVVQQFNGSHNLPIDFYGQVIDQDSNPVPDVKINVSIYQMSISPSTNSAYPKDFGVSNNIARLEKETGADGRFEINGETGYNVNFDSIQKAGYEVEPGANSFGSSSGSIENPVIFKMWSTNIHEQLITGDKKFQIVPDGRPYFINLTDGTISESGEGDLKVWIKYPAQVTSGQLYDWSCEIDLENGGLLEEPLGTALYMAPADGYAPSFQLQQQIKGGQYGSIGERHFYVMLKNGKEYGQIAIDLYAPYTDQVPGLIRLSYAINTSGSRILR